SRLPAGISSSSSSTAARYWRTSNTASPCSITGTTETAPGWWTMSRSNSLPSGATNVPTATLISGPRWTIRSERFWNPVNVDEPRGAAFGPGQRSADQRPEQRMGPVGSALELGVGLGADPEDVAGQLDELDQAIVGRR